MKMNIKPSLRYQVTDLLKSSVAFTVTIIFVTLFIPLLKSLLETDGGTVTFGGYGIIASVFLFVVGIVAPRSYLRLDIQMGVSRATSFVVMFIAIILTSAIVSAIGTVLSAMVQVLFAGSEDSFFMDLYQMMYYEGEAMGFMGFFTSFLFDTCMCVCTYICGMFFTLLFWRLNKFWTIVVAIAMFLLLNVGLNVAIAEFAPLFADVLQSYFEAIARGPGALMITFLVISAFFGIIEWLLLRRAYIKAAIG